MAYGDDVDAFLQRYTRQKLRDEAMRQGVSPDEVDRLAGVESSYDPSVITGGRLSTKGAIGTMQLMPGTANDLGVDPYNLEDNIRGGVTYYKKQRDRFGNAREAAAAYNAGPGAVQKYGGVPPYKETQDYVQKMGASAQPAAQQQDDEDGVYDFLDRYERGLVGPSGQQQPAANLGDQTPLVKPANRPVKKVPLSPEMARFRQAAMVARAIEAKRDEAVRMFQEADRTSEIALETDDKGKRILDASGKVIYTRNKLRSRAEGTLQEAWYLAKQAQQTYGDLLEIGFGQDSNPQSNREWPYAKAKQVDRTVIVDPQTGLESRQYGPDGKKIGTAQKRLSPHGGVQMFINKTVEERAAESTPEDIARTIAQQDRIAAERARIQGRGRLGRFGERVTTEFLGFDPNPSPAARRDLTERRAAFGRDEEGNPVIEDPSLYTPEPTSLQNLGGRVARGLLKSAAVAPGGVASLLDAATTPPEFMVPKGAKRGSKTPFRDAYNSAVGSLQDEAYRAATALTPVNEKDKNFWTSSLPEGFGSAAAFFVPGRLAGMAGFSGKAVGATIGAGMNVDSIEREMNEAGMPQGTRRNLGVLFAGLTGATETLLGLGKTLDQFGLKRSFYKRMGEIFEEGGQEALQEWLNNINAIAVAGYDPRRPQDRNVIESAILGGIIGMGFQGADLAKGAAGKLKAVITKKQENGRPVVKADDLLRGPSGAQPGAAPAQPATAPLAPTPGAPATPEGFAPAQPNLSPAPAGEVTPAPVPVSPAAPVAPATPATPAQPAAEPGSVAEVIQKIMAMRPPQLTPEQKQQQKEEKRNQERADKEAATEAERSQRYENYRIQAEDSAAKAQTLIGDGDYTSAIAEMGVQRDALQQSIANLPKTPQAVQTRAELQRQMGTLDAQIKEYRRQEAEARKTGVRPGAANATEDLTDGAGARSTGRLPGVEETFRGNYNDAKNQASLFEDEGRFEDAVRELDAAFDNLKRLRNLPKYRTPKTAEDADKRDLLTREISLVAGERGRLMTRYKAEQARLRKTPKSLDQIRSEPRAASSDVMPTRPLSKEETGGKNLTPLSETGPQPGPLLRSIVNPEGGNPESYQDPNQLYLPPNRGKKGDTGEKYDNVRLIGRIRQLGGINPGGVYTGDLQGAIDKRLPGMINRKDGYGPDDMLQMLADEGYNVDPSDLNSLFDAIDRDIRNGNEYPLTRSRTGEFEEGLSDYYENLPDDVQGDVDAQGPTERDLVAPEPRPATSRRLIPPKGTTGNLRTGSVVEPAIADAPTERLGEEDAPQPAGKTIREQLDDFRDEMDPEDLEALERALANVDREDPREYADRTRPGNVGSGLSYSPYAVIVANNKEQVKALYDTPLNTEEGQGLVDTIREYAVRNDIPLRHVHNMLNYIRGWQMQRARLEDQGIDPDEFWALQWDELQGSIDYLEQEEAKASAKLPEIARRQLGTAELGRLHQAGQELDSLLYALHDDSDLMESYEQAVAGDDDAYALFEEGAVNEYAIPIETVRYLVESRRAAERIIKERNRGQESGSGRASNALAPVAGPRGDRRTGRTTPVGPETRLGPKEYGLLNADPASLSDAEFDEVLVAIETLRNKGIVGPFAGGIELTRGQEKWIRDVLGKFQDERHDRVMAKRLPSRDPEPWVPTSAQRQARRVFAEEIKDLPSEERARRMREFKAKQMEDVGGRPARKLTKEEMAAVMAGLIDLNEAQMSDTPLVPEWKPRPITAEEYAGMKALGYTKADSDSFGPGLVERILAEGRQKPKELKGRKPAPELEGAPERPQLPAGPDVKELGPAPGAIPLPAAPDRKALPPAPEQPAGRTSTGELSDMFDRIMGDIAGEEAGDAVTDGEKIPQNVEKILDSGILAPMPKTEVKQYWYHGSMDSTIGDFTPREVKNYDSVGTWFTSDPELAADIYGRNVYEIEEQMGNFIEGDGDFYQFFGSNIPLIREVFGDKAADQIENVPPNTSRARKLLLDRENGRWQNLSYQQRASLAKELKGLEESNKIARQAMNSPRYMKAWRQMMKDAGYDGVVWRNSRNDLGSEIEEGRTHDVYLVFHDKPISRKKVEAATEAGTPGQEAESDALNQKTETAAAEGRQSAPVPGSERETVRHPDPAIDGKPVIEKLYDGRVVVENPENASGVSVVKDRSEEERDYDSSSTQVNLPKELADKVREFGKRIPDSALADKGREDQPHITVKYGLKGSRAGEVRKILEGAGPISAKLGKVSLFTTNPDFDVVKIEVISDDLQKLHQQIADAVPNEEKFPEYNPHVTVAYVKKGEGAKYAGYRGFVGQQLTFDKVQFSGWAGNKENIPVTGEKAETPATKETTQPTKGYEGMASREQNAINSMIETIMELGEMSRADAERVFDRYKKDKLFDTKDVFVGGQLRVKNGAFLDRDVLRRAAGLDETPAETAPATPRTDQTFTIGTDAEVTAAKPDQVFAISQGKTYFTLWTKRNNAAGASGQWHYISILPRTEAEAIKAAEAAMRDIASGKGRNIAFWGDKAVAQQEAKTFGLITDKMDPRKLVPAEQTSIGDKPLGFGKYRDVAVADLFDKDPNYALWAADNLNNSAHARAVAAYLKSRPEYAEAKNEALAKAQDFMNEKNLDVLKGFEIEANVSGDKILLTGKTYDYKDIIKQAGGYFSDGIWSISADRAQGLIEKLDGLPRPARGQRGGVPAYVSNPQLGELRRTADERPDRSGLERPATTIVGADTQSLLKRGIKAGMPASVIDEQIEDVAKLRQAYDRKQGLFLLASEPGSGKTFVLGAAIRELRAAGAKKITYVTLRQELISQIKNDLADYDIGDVNFITYPEMREAKAEASDVLIFDEAHSVKNVDAGDGGAQQAKAAAKWIRQSKFTVFSTATPFENPVQAAYLEPTGIFAPFGGHKKFALAYGANLIEVNTSNGPTEALIWRRNPQSDKDATAAREYFVKEGVFTSRPIRLPEGKVDARMSKVSVPAEAVKMYEELMAAAERNEDLLHGFGAAYIVNLQKRILEAAKVQQGIEEARDAIKRGRYPILFVETKAERNIDIEDLIRREEEWRRAVAEAQQQRDKPPSRAQYKLPPPGVVDVLASYAAATDQNTINIPSAEDVIIKALGADNVAIFTGSVSPKKAQQNLDAWRRGEKKVIVATMAKGGTGLSLHDKVGDHPTTQIVINLPWTATQVKQVAQRNARYGLQSKAEINWIFADNIPFDRMLAARVGGRMADMGASVYGSKLTDAEKLQDWDLETQTFSQIRAQMEGETAPSVAETEVPAEAPATKQPWEMTRDEFIKGRNPEREDFTQGILNSVGTGEPGLSSVAKDYGAGRVTAPGREVVYRDPNGKPVAAARLVEVEGKLTTTDFVTDKTRGLLAGRAAVAVGREIERLGAATPTNTMSPDAAGLMHHNAVRSAIAEGKSVSAEVLADYPDLARTSTQAEAKPESVIGQTIEHRDAHISGGEVIAVSGDGQQAVVKTPDGAIVTIKHPDQNQAVKKLESTDEPRQFESKVRIVDGFTFKAVTDGKKVFVTMARAQEDWIGDAPLSDVEGTVAFGRRILEGMRFGRKMTPERTDRFASAIADVAGEVQKLYQDAQPAKPAAPPVNTADLSSAFDKQLEDLLNEGESPAPAAPEQPSPAPRPLRSRKEAATAPKATTAKPKTSKAEKTAREPKSQEPARDMKQIAKELELLFGETPENVKPDSGLLESALGRMTDQQLRQSLGDPSIPTETPRATLEYLARRQMRSVEPTKPEKTARPKKSTGDFVTSAIKAMTTQDLTARLKEDGVRIPPGATRGEIENLARQLVEAEFNSIVPAYYEDPADIRQYRARLQDEMRGMGGIKSPSYTEPKFVKDARQRLREAASGKRAGSGGQQLIDMAIVAGWKAYKTGITFSQWADAVVKQAGERVRPALADAWAQIRSLQDWENVYKPISTFILARVSAKSKAKDIAQFIIPNAQGHSAATKAGVKQSDIDMSGLKEFIEANPEANVSKVLDHVRDAAPQFDFITLKEEYTFRPGKRASMSKMTSKRLGTGENHREIWVKWEDAPEGVNFLSPVHYDEEPNIILDFQFEDLKTTNGDNALAFLEAQSDWSQAKDAPPNPIKNTWMQKSVEYAFNLAIADDYDGLIFPKSTDQLKRLQEWRNLFQDEQGEYRVDDRNLGYQEILVTAVVRRYQKEFPKLIEAYAKQIGSRLETREVDTEFGREEFYYVQTYSPQFEANYWRTRRVANLPTTVSEKLDVIEKAKSEFRPGKNAPGTLWMNHQSVITISGVAKKLGIPLEASIWGVSIEPNSVSNIADKLDEAAQDIGEQHGREYGDPIRSIAASMREAVEDANAYKQDRIVVVDSTSVNFRTMRVTLREERFHRWQAAQKFRDPAIAAKIHNALINDPTYTKIRNILLDPNEFDSKIPYENKPDVLITEASAKIASGQWKDYRLESPEEGYRFLKEYFRIGARLIGPKALKEKAPGVRQAREVQEDVQREFGSTKSRRRIRGSEETGGTGGIEFAKPRVPGRNERGRPPGGESETQGSLFGDSAESGSSQPVATAAEPAERAKPEQIQQTGIDEEKYRVTADIFEDAYKLFADKATNPIEAMNMLLRTLRYEYGFSTDKLAAMKPYVLRFIKDKAQPGNIQQAQDGGDENETDAVGTGKSGLPGGRTTGSIQEAEGERGTRSARESGGGRGERVSGTDDRGRGGDVERPGDSNGIAEGTVRTPQIADAITSSEDIVAATEEKAAEADPSRAPSQQPSSTMRAPDFSYDSAESISPGGKKTKLKANFAAIRLLRQIQSEGRTATREEQEVLSKFTGWGQFPEVFNEFNESGEKWDAEREELKALLGNEEDYEKARRSTQYAHYTAPGIVEQMWEVVRGLGFSGGRVLESSMGVGYFFGLMPKDLRVNSQMTGVEMEPTPAGIAKLLYPSANIQNKKFEDFNIPDGFYDVVIGNVPFSNEVKPYDRRYAKYRPNLHDYFIMKSIDKVREGGIVAVITSTGTMDKKDSWIREAFDKKADLIAAMRFPEGSHQKNAGTQVVTDLLIFQKRREGDAKGPNSFINLAEAPDADGGAPIEINEYFVKNPQMILGRLDRKSRLYKKGEMNVSLTDDFDQRLQAALNSIPANVMDASQASSAFSNVQIANSEELDGVPDGSFVDRGGKIMIRDGDTFAETTIPPADYERMKGLMEVRDALRSLIQAQMRDENTQAGRDNLHRVYDRFVKKFGALRKKTNVKLFTNDPASFLVLALEKSYDSKTGKAQKADIFYKDVIYKQKRVENVQTPADAISASLFESGKLSLPRIAELLNVSEDEAAKQLSKSGLAFLNPNGNWETAEQYLSGTVRRKLIEAREAAKADSRFQANVEALEKVQPPDIGAEDIYVKLGAPWVPPSDIADFAASLMGAQADNFNIIYSQPTSTWVADYSPSGRSIKSSQNAIEAYGTADKNFIDLLEAALNDRPVKVTRYDSAEKKSYVDEDATIAANAKTEEIKDAFQNWIWQEDERALRLHRYYNDNYNDIRVIEYRGEHYKNDQGKLILPGMNPMIELRPNQVKDIWQAVVNGKLLDASEVGAGKTFIMGGIAMEWRRLGLAKKPAIVVPKSRLADTVKEIQLMYPAAKILSLIKGFTATERKATTARIATGDYDIVVMSHEQLDKMPLSPAIAEEYINEELREVSEQIVEAQDMGGQEGNRIVKRLEAVMERLENKLEQILDGANKDDAVFFEETGIDAILVDEAHAFKSLPVYSRRYDVKGIPQTRSDRATNMDMRVKWIYEQNRNRGVVFATGTPISNTMAELYNMQRYLQPEALESRGIKNFDAWVDVFADTDSKFEHKANGDFQPVTRLASFVNIPELRNLVGQIMATNFVDDMPWITRPKKVEQVITVPMSESQVEYRKSIRRRVEVLKRMSPKDRKASGENYLVISTDARKSALSSGLVQAGGKDPGGKIEAAANKVLEIHKARPGVTQMIFSDMGINETPWKYSVYKELKQRLVEGGIPANKIVDFSKLSDNAKGDAAQKLKKGEFLVGIGSSWKMGTGVNAQDKLAAIHHIDAPWVPAFVEQRNGRGYRQGNTNPEIEIFYYTTQGSFDLVMWQAINRKWTFIQQFMRGDNDLRVINMDDVGGDDAAEDGPGAMSPEMIMAMTSENPYEMEFVRLRQEVDRLKRMEKNHRSGETRIRNTIASARRRIPELEEQIAKIDQELAHLDSIKENPPPIKINGKTYEKRVDAANQLVIAMAMAPKEGVYKIGEYKGYDLMVNRRGEEELHRGDVFLKGKADQYYANFYEDDLKDPISLFNSLDGKLRSVSNWKQNRLDQIEDAKRDIEQAQARLGLPFKHASKLDKAMREFSDVQRKMKGFIDKQNAAQSQMTPANFAEMLGKINVRAKDGAPVAAMMLRKEYLKRFADVADLNATIALMKNIGIIETEAGAGGLKDGNGEIVSIKLASDWMAKATAYEARMADLAKKPLTPGTLQSLTEMIQSPSGEISIPALRRLAGRWFQSGTDFDAYLGELNKADAISLYRIYGNTDSYQEHLSDLSLVDGEYYSQFGFERGWQEAAENIEAPVAPKSAQVVEDAEETPAVPQYSLLDIGIPVSEGGKGKYRGEAHSGDFSDVRRDLRSAETPTPESADQILERIFKVQQTGDRVREFDIEKAVKDIKATVKPGYNEPGAMLVNLAGTIILTAAHKAAGIPSGGTGFFIGKVMHNKQAMMIADALESNVQDYEEGDNLRKLAQKLRDAVDDAESYGESGIVILNVDRMALTPVDELINEERFHQRQFTLGLHNVKVTPKITTLIDKDPVYQKVRRNLTEKMGYTDDPTLITTEVSAQLAAGRWQMHGLSSEQEALDFLDKYFTAAAQVVGPHVLEVDFPGTEASKGVQANVRRKLGIENRTETRYRRGGGANQTGRDSGSEASGPAGGMERGDGSRRGSGSEAPDGGNVSTPESADSGPVRRFLKDEEGSARIDLGLGKLFSKTPPKTTPLRQIADMLGHERVEIDVTNLRDQTLDAIVEAVQKGKYGTLPGARAYYWANKWGKTSIGKAIGADTRAKKIEQRQVKFLNDALNLLTTIADNSTKMSQHQRGTRDYERAKRDMDQARVQLANTLSKLGEYTHPATYAAKGYKASILSAPHIPYFNVIQQVFQFPAHEAQRAVDFMVPTKVFEKYGIKYDKAPGDIRTWAPAMDRELKAMRDGVATSWGDIASMLKYGVSVSELNREFADEVEKTRGRRKSGSAVGTTDKYEMGHRPRMIPGLDQVSMMVGRVQGAADVLFTNMTEATALAAAAESEARRIAKEHPYLNLTEAQIKELAADLAYEPSPALAAAAGDVAARFRLDYPTWPYEFLVKLRENERIKMGGTHVEAVWKAAIDFVIPFSKIPLAAVDTALFKYSPFGLVRTASRLNKAGKEFEEAKRKGQAQYADPEFTQATVELYRQGLVGTAAWILLGALGTLGYIGFTGGRDDDDERRKIDNAKEILNQPYRAEMTIGNTAFDLGKMGPVGQAAAVGARTAEASKRRFVVKAGEYEPRGKQLARTIGTGLKEALTTNPVGQGLEDTSEPLSSGDLAKGAGKLAQGKLRSVVPGAVRELARVTDDKRRQSDQVDFLSRVEGDIRSGIPGLRQGLQPRINALGEPVEESNPFSFMRNRRRDALLEDMIERGTGPSKLRREPGESMADYNARAIERGRQNVEAMNRLRGPQVQNQSPDARRGMYDRAMNPQQLTRSGKLSEQSIDAESQIEALRSDAVQMMTTMPEWESMSGAEKAQAQKLISEELRAFRARAGGQTRRGFRRERVAVMPEWTPAELARAALNTARK